jgi:hypothetical protein
MDKKQIEKYSDVSSNRAPKLPLPEVRLDGKAGEFVFVDEKDYSKSTIGKAPIKVNILKIRKRLFDFNSGFTTNEHISSRDEIVLFKPKDINNRKLGVTIERGISSEIREKYKSLKTEQIVYSIYEGQLVRLIVKGGSLGTPNDPTASGFYDYLSSFKDGSHAWEFETIITPVPKRNGAVSYTAMSFARGDELTPEQLDLIGEKMELLFKFWEKVEKYNQQSRMGSQSKEVESEEIPTVQVEDDSTDEIKTEDLPF